MIISKTAKAAERRNRPPPVVSSSEDAGPESDLFVEADGEQLGQNKLVAWLILMLLLSHL